MLYRDVYNYINSFTNFERVPGLNLDTEHDGLERFRLLMRLLGRPHRQFKSIIVAGTKGKGSVAAMLDSALREAGYHTGLYTSPHLHTLRERMRIDGELISIDDVVRLAQRVSPVVERISWLEDPTLIPTTYELITALAFLYFQEQKVDFAVLEVGLGGRLDAVNICEPLISVITSISLDHTQVLGDTLEQIAEEKAGIIKQNGHVVTAPQAPEVMAVINRVASERNADVTSVGRDVYISTDQLPEVVFDDDMVPQHQVFNVRMEGEEPGQSIRMRIKTPLLGSHQQVNATLALGALGKLVELGIKIDREAVVAGLRNVNWPGRLEVVHRDPVVIVDGAHNVDSMSKLNQAVSELFHLRRLIVVLGISNDKDIPGIIGELSHMVGSFLGLQVERVIVTRADNARAADPREIVQQAIHRGLKVEMRDTVPVALRRAEELANNLGANEFGTPVILVTGSLFVVAEARAHYGLAPDLTAET